MNMFSGNLTRIINYELSLVRFLWNSFQLSSNLKFLCDSRISFEFFWKALPFRMLFACDFLVMRLFSLIIFWTASTSVKWCLNLAEKYEYIGRLLRPGETSRNYSDGESEGNSSEEEENPVSGNVANEWWNFFFSSSPSPLLWRMYTFLYIELLEDASNLMYMVSHASFYSSPFLFFNSQYTFKRISFCELRRAHILLDFIIFCS